MSYNPRIFIDNSDVIAIDAPYTETGVSYEKLSDIRAHVLTQGMYKIIDEAVKRGWKDIVITTEDIYPFLADCLKEYYKECYSPEVFKCINIRAARLMRDN